MINLELEMPEANFQEWEKRMGKANKTLPENFSPLPQNNNQEQMEDMSEYLEYKEERDQQQSESESDEDKNEGQQSLSFKSNEPSELSLDMQTQEALKGFANSDLLQVNSFIGSEAIP